MIVPVPAPWTQDNRLLIWVIATGIAQTIMWSQLIGGVAARTPEKVRETEERMGSAPPAADGATTDSPGILGARFGYIGRITSKFIEQVAAEEEEDDQLENEEGWEDGIEEEAEDGWNDEDNNHMNVETSDITSFSVEDDFLSANQDHREVTGKLDNVLHEIEEQELQVTNASFQQDDGTSISDQEHQELAVQEIRHEIGHLINNEEDDDSFEAKTSFSPQLNTNHHLVDHTPAELDEDRETDPSIIALATVEDMTRNTNDDEDMEEDHEEDYGPVVDQTPPAFSHVSSLAARVASDAYSICDDETDAAGVGGWGDEKHEDDLDVVDHTPSEIVDSPEKRRDVGSVDVLASVAENSITGGDSFGLVVDQTPVTPATRWARSESVIVQANDDLGTVDETTVARYDGEGDEDTLRDDGVQSGDEDHLVDYIPSRADSRYGDGSTFAAADPSEILSVVDGLAPDDQNFGPVVDVTPPPLVDAPVLCEGSTVAFASPSIAVDDSDAEEDGPPEDNGTWEHTENDEAPNPQSGNDEALESTQLVDFLPPVHVPSHSFVMRAEEQSDFTVVGGQSAILQGENPREDDFGPVVDQIPSGRHASHISLASTATQLTYSEYQAIVKDDQLHGKPDESSVRSQENAVVDHLPPIEAKRQVDSTITVGRSSQSEEEEGEEDTTKFGPVVDQLPTSRASIAPSRGGSTVDALGAVSEVNSDEEEETGGWDEDASLGGISDTTERQTVPRPKPMMVSDGDRSVSVRFDATADGGYPTQVTSQWRPLSQDSDVQGEEARGTNRNVDTLYTGDRLMNDSSSNGYHDASETMQDNKSFAEADTPPTTPYRRSSDPNINTVSDGLTMPTLGSELRCCLDNNDSEKSLYDFIKNVIASDSDGNEAFVMGRIRLKDGREIEIDFRKLLHDEATKRKLAEENIRILQKDMNGRSSQQTSSLESNEEAMTKRLVDTERDRLQLHELNLTLKRQLVESQHFARKIEVERDEIYCNEAAMKAEIDELKAIMMTTTVVANDDDKIQGRLFELQSMLASKSGECKKLAVKVAQLEDRLRAAEENSFKQAQETADLSKFMKQTVDSLRNQLSGSDDLLTRTERARLLLDEKLKALELEVANLRASGKQVAELQIRHEKDLQEQYKLLDRKTADLETLERLVVSLQHEKSKLVDDLSQQRALAEHSETLATELLSVAMERDLLEKSLSESRSTMTKLQKFIEAQELEKAEIDFQREKEWSELRKELAAVGVSLKEAKEEAQGYVKHIHELEDNLAQTKREFAELSVAKDTAEADKASLEAHCSEIEAKYADALVTFQLTASQQEANFQLELGKLDATCKELQGEIERFGDAENLHACALEEVRSNALSEARKYEESIQNLVSECDQMKSELSRLEGLEQKHKVDLLELRHQSSAEIAGLKSELMAQTEIQIQSRKAFVELEKEMASLMIDHNEETARLTMECDRLRSELSMYQDAQDQLAIASDVQEKLRTELKQQSEAHEMEAVRLQLQCDRLQAEVSMYVESKQEDITACKSLEAKLKECTAQNQSTLQQKDSEIEALQSRITQIEIEATHSAKQLLEAKAECTAMVVENEELLIQLGWVKQQMDGMTSSNAALDAKAKDEIQKVVGELASVTESRNALSQQIKSLQDTLKDFEIEKAQATDTINHLRSDSEALQIQLDELKAKLEQSQSFHDRMLVAEKDAADRSVALMELHAEVALLQDQYVGALNNIEVKQKTIEDLAKRLDDKTTSDQLEAALAQLADYEQQLKIKDSSLEAQKEIVVLLTESERQIQDLQTKLREKNIDIRQMEDKLEAITTKSEFIPQVETAQLCSLKEEIEALNNALQATRSRLSTKERDLDELRILVTELREEQTPQSTGLPENRSISLGRPTHIQETIARAMKLKRPDHVRADALKRLEEERAKNADALAALKASVERYYS